MIHMMVGNLLDRSQNANFVQSIFLFFFCQALNFYLFQSILNVVTLAGDLVNLTVGASTYHKNRSQIILGLIKREEKRCRMKYLPICLCTWKSRILDICSLGDCYGPVWGTCCYLRIEAATEFLPEVVPFRLAICCYCEGLLPR